MDLLAAEIAKKRKANALLSAVGGVGKYAKKGAKEEAARVAAAVTGLGDSSGAVDVTTGLDVVTTTGDTDGASLKRDGDAGGTTPTHNNDHHSKQEPHDDVAKLDETECIRRLRLLKAPATLFGEDEFARRARFRNVIATVIVRDEHATGGQQANERKRVLDELAKEEKLRFERLGMEDGIGRGRKGTALGDLDGTGPAGPSSARDGSINTEDTETQGNEKEEDLDDVFAAAAKRVKAAAEANAKHPADQIVFYFKSVLLEWETEIKGMSEKQPTWQRTEQGKQSSANARLCSAHLKPLFKKCKKRTLPEDLQRALFLMVKRMRARDYRSAADAYVGVAIGNAAWPIGVTMVGIHERSARTKINAQTQAHAMHDEETRKYLQSVKRLMTFAQRRWPSTPSMSLDFNSGHNGWDKASLMALEGTVDASGKKVDVRDVIPALALPDPNDPNPASAKTRCALLTTAGSTRKGAADGWSSKSSDVRTWRSVLKTAYEGEEGGGGVTSARDVWK